MRRRPAALSLDIRLRQNPKQSRLPHLWQSNNPSLQVASFPTAVIPSTQTHHASTPSSPKFSRHLAAFWLLGRKNSAPNPCRGGACPSRLLAAPSLPRYFFPSLLHNIQPGQKVAHQS